MKKYLKFGLIVVLLMVAIGNIVAEEVTLRFKKPSNLGTTQLYICVWGEKGGDTNVMLTPAWPGIPIFVTDDEFFAYTFDNAGFGWINANINNNLGGDGNGQDDNNFSRDIKSNPTDFSINATNKDVKNGGYYIINTDWRDIYEPNLSSGWPQMFNYNLQVNPHQPTEPIYLGDVKNLTFGCNTWGTYNSYYPKYRLWLSYNDPILYNSTLSTDWSAPDYQDKKEATYNDFLANQVGQWYWGIEVDYQHSDISHSLWYAMNVYNSTTTTWTDMLLKNQLESKANLFFEVQAIPTPTSVVVSGTNLVWAQNSVNHDVIVFKDAAPTQGTEYTVSSNCIYKGSGTSASLSGSGIYTIYSVNNNYYSDAETIAYLEAGDTDILSDGTPLTDGKVYLKYTAPADNTWDFIGLPFNVTSVKGTGGTELTRGTHYGIAKYDGSLRASSGAGWGDKNYTGTLDAGGYAIWVNVSDKTLIFEGTLSSENALNFAPSSSGSVTHHTGAAADVHHGWNLITNPLYTTVTATLGSGQKYYIYNSSTKAYDVEDGTSSSVAPFTSWFIKTAATGSVDLSFSKTSPVSAAKKAVPEKLTLYLNNDYKTVVRFNENALLGYDDIYDAPYMAPLSFAVPQIYTLNNAGKMAINSIPESTGINLGFRFATAGEYTLSWDNQLIGTNLSLIDGESGAIDMATQSSYSFTAAAGEINDRFSIEINRVPTGLIQIDGNVKVYSENNTLVVAGLDKATALRVYDLSGRTIANENITSSEVRIPAQKGIYVVVAGDKRFKLVNQ